MSTKAWVGKFLDDAKEVMGVDCSGLVGIVSAIAEAHHQAGVTEAQEEVARNGFGNIKSGKKLAKKLRQVYQRELHDLADSKTDKLYKTFEEHVRPKPRFVPAFAWRLIQRAVLQHYV